VGSTAELSKLLKQGFLNNKENKSTNPWVGLVSINYNLKDFLNIPTLKDVAK
jgi:hypothetical protein